MLYVKNYVIFGAIRSLFAAFFTVIYKIISVFRLQPFLFCIVAGALVEIAFGWIGGTAVGFAVFHLSLCLCVAYAVIAVIAGILRPHGRAKKQRAATQLVSGQAAPSKETPEFSEAEKRQAPPLREETRPREEFPPRERVKYYRVKQNPAYVMAEFGDRVELYKEENGRLAYVRTDYKNKE